MKSKALRPMAIICLLALMLNSPYAAARDGREEPRQKATDGQVVVTDGTFKLLSSKVTVDKVVKGAPYSATAITEQIQTLGDGNQIIRRNEAKIYRDGEGRVRSDQKLGTIGKWAAAGEPPEMITITDPTAGFSYTLDSRTRTVRKSQMILKNRPDKSVTVERDSSVTRETDAERKFEQEKEKLIENKMKLEEKQTKEVERDMKLEEKQTKEVENQSKMKERENKEAENRMKLKELESKLKLKEKELERKAKERERQNKERERQAEEKARAADRPWPPAPPAKGAPGAPSAPSSPENPAKPAAPPEEKSGPAGIKEDGSTKMERLGTQVIEGVQAEGRRATRTIPAGSIGNVRDIEIVEERWYSPELQVMVMMRLNDPRSGAMSYRLTNIQRGEPDRSLFEVPFDYAVDDGSMPKVKRLTKPEESPKKPSPAHKAH